MEFVRWRCAARPGFQDDLVATWAEMPRSPGHAFYDRLQALLKEAGFDAFVEDLCKPYYAPSMGAPSLPPGRYFRMHMVGYFEGIDSERGICWRCSDSLSLREFLRLASPRQGCRSFLAVEDTLAPAARGPRKGFRLGSVSRCRARFGEGRADRRRRLDDGSQRCPADDRAARQRRDLSPDADANGQGERRRDADDRRPGPAGSQAEGQETLEQGLDEPDRSGCEDRADEGRHHASVLQA